MGNTSGFVLKMANDSDPAEKTTSVRKTETSGPNKDYE